MTRSVNNHRRRLALEMLADAGARGRADPEFVARFTPELLDLMGDGLATAEREIVISRGRPFEVARVRITEEGWRAVEEYVGPGPQRRVGSVRLAETRSALSEREISCASRRHKVCRHGSRKVTTVPPIIIASPFDSPQTSFCSKKQKNQVFAK